MSALLPGDTRLGDLVAAALKDAGAIGVGQTPTAEDMTDAWAQCQWMLQSWERKRWYVYHLITYFFVSTGAIRYPIGGGTGGDFSPSDFNDDFFVGTVAVRPDKIESAFLRQLTQSQPNQIDYPLDIVHSYEDYSRIALKELVSFPGVIFYDPAWPIGYLYPWPVPQANIYGVGVQIKEQLPWQFAGVATKINLPFEYYLAIVKNLAMLVRPKYGIRTKPGDVLPGQARDALQALVGANTAIASLVADPALSRRGIYNIFSDRSY